MDFIIGFPTTKIQYDSTMVVVDKLTKATHFIPVKYTYKASDIAQIFIRDIFRLHEFSKAIILDRDAKFTSNF